jgi:rRNA maturation endonuclease Nob1
VSRNRICPECETEYLPHIEKCADCGSVLLLPEELIKAQEEKRRIRQKTVENTAIVREGDLDWLSELRAVLTDAGIPAAVRAASDCGQGCCGGSHRLVVTSDHRERAQERIEEYLMEINPELRASNELLREGKCPACASPVSDDARECPDCGLPLLILEDDEEQEGN